jgi:hypothetical protein
MAPGWRKQSGIERRVKMANCQDFTIKLQNSTHGEIRTTKFEYKDGSKWKTENMFGLDGYQKIEKDHYVEFKRDLEGVGGETTQFKVTYKHHIGGTVWSTEKYAYSDTFTAIDNGRKTVVMTA